MNFLDFFKRNKKTNNTQPNLENDDKNNSDPSKNFTPVSEIIEFRDKHSENQISSILDKTTEKLFPETGSWYSSCFSKPNQIATAYLPCHLRDNMWLSEYFNRELEKQGLKIPFPVIYQYVKTSPFFEKERHNYELRIVEWQIGYMTNSGNSGWLLPEGTDELTYYFGQNPDKIFRESLVKTLRKIGMNNEVIEEGLEVYSDQWRPQLMDKAFFRQFQPTGFLKVKPCPFPSPSHHENWIKMRNYQYYQQHHRFVDMYGQKDPGMEMSDDEAYQLNNILIQQNQTRKQFIKNYEENTPSCSL